MFVVPVYYSRAVEEKWRATSRVSRLVGGVVFQVFVVPVYYS